MDDGTLERRSLAEGRVEDYKPDRVVVLQG
jgi:hypothetical protein